MQRFKQLAAGIDSATVSARARHASTRMSSIAMPMQCQLAARQLPRCWEHCCRPSRREPCDRDPVPL